MCDRHHFTSSLPSQPSTTNDKEKMDMEVDDATNAQQGDNTLPTIEMLLAAFEALDETRRQIFWFYYLHLFTSGGLGGDPLMVGSKFHYKVSAVWTSNITFNQFSYRAKQVIKMVFQFNSRNIRPPGNIPSFLVPLDGGRRPDVVTLENLRWVAIPRNPQPDEMWD